MAILKSAPGKAKWELLVRPWAAVLRRRPEPGVSSAGRTGRNAALGMRALSLTRGLWSPARAPEAAVSLVRKQCETVAMVGGAWRRVQGSLWATGEPAPGRAGEEARRAPRGRGRPGGCAGPWPELPGGPGRVPDIRPEATFMQNVQK